MAVLLIGVKEKADIAQAIERARKRPVTLDLVRQWAHEDKKLLKLADRKPGFRRTIEPQQVLIPFGYRACVSFEEQPGGISMHLSISVERDDPKWTPSVPAVAVIAQEFGISPDKMQEGTVWMEEYEPGRHAVNILVVTAPRQEGHA